MRKDFSLPGFRKGRVPRNILEKRLAQRFFTKKLPISCCRRLIPRRWKKNIEPVARPEIEIEQMVSEKPFIYTATVTVKPQVTLGEYKGLNISGQTEEVSAEDVEGELKYLQNSRARLIALKGEDAVAAEQDQVIIDFVGRADGKEFKGGSATNFPLVLGSGSFVPGFEEQLLGARPGDRITVKVSMPAEYHNEELAGKEVEFDVTVNEVKRKELPALDDDFAREVGDFDTLEELRASIRERLEDRARSLQSSSCGRRCSRQCGTISWLTFLP